MRYLSLLIVIGAGIFVFSCGHVLDSNEQPGMHPLESAVLFDIGSHWPDRDQHILIVQTAKFYPCANFPLSGKIHVDLDRREITMAVNGVGELGDGCLTAFGPAQGFWLLPELTPGTYSLSLELRYPERGTVIDHYTIDFESWDNLTICPANGDSSSVGLNAVPED